MLIKPPKTLRDTPQLGLRTTRPAFHISILDVTFVGARWKVLSNMRFARSFGQRHFRLRIIIVNCPTCSFYA